MFYSLRRIWFYAWVEFKRYRFSLRTRNHDAPLDPLKVEWVDPSRITRISGRENPPYKNRFEQFGRVEGGDWDIGSNKEYPDTVDEHPVYRQMLGLFGDETVPDEEEFIEETRCSIEAGESVFGEVRVADVRAKFRSYTSLYCSIRNQGYKPQTELFEENPSCVSNPCWLLDEVMVDVARDGELLFVDGTHRLSVAKILGLEEIPVIFLVRHPEWMHHRERCYSEGGPYSHPDLQEFDR